MALYAPPWRGPSSRQQFCTNAPLVRKAIEAAGASLVFLPAYSPDFNPIENAFAKLKALLRQAAERTIRGLWRLIGQLIETFTPQNVPTTLLPRDTIRIKLK